MKAVKLYKIEWHLAGLDDTELKKAVKKLPTVFGFTAKDDFNVAEKVPTLLQKKFGYAINTFSFVECPIAENVDQLLRLNADKGTEDKDMFTTHGKLTKAGKCAFENLKRNVKWRMELEDKGTSYKDMPAILDTVMLGIEKISGMSWEGNNPDTLFGAVIKKIRDYHDDPLEMELDEEEEED